MTNFAVINNSIVENIIVCDSIEIAEAVTGKTCIEYLIDIPVCATWIYDGVNFIPPVEIIPSVEIVE